MIAYVEDRVRVFVDETNPLLEGANICFDVLLTARSISMKPQAVVPTLQLSAVSLTLSNLAK